MNYVICSLSHDLFTSSSKTSRRGVTNRPLNLVVHHGQLRDFTGTLENTASSAAGHDSSLLPHILFMFQAFFFSSPRLATGHCSVRACVSVLGQGACALLFRSADLHCTEIFLLTITAPTHTHTHIYMHTDTHTHTHSQTEF